MKITEKDVAYVADLANLELTSQERERMVRDLNSILDYIDRLNELDTSGIPAMAQTVAASNVNSKAAKEAVLREDELVPCLPRKDALANAPDSDGAFFRVPKVIER